MKYLEMPNILKTNALFSRLNILDPTRSIEVEVYSCKETKKQKKNYNKNYNKNNSRTSIESISSTDVTNNILTNKLLKYFISALSESFPDYDFSNNPMNFFKETHYEFLISELAYILFTVYRNHEEVSEVLSFFDNILKQSIGIKAASIYYVENLFLNERDKYRVFLIYDKSMKRVIVIILQDSKNIAE